MDDQFEESQFEAFLPDYEDFNEAEETKYIDSIASLELLGDDSQVGQIPIYPNEVLKFGREGCTHTIPDPLRQVSKQHFRIYSVMYEQEKREVLPLIYCEDLESTNGTYVNNMLIGQIDLERIGYLLSDGDIIEIRPSWKFMFHQPNHNITHIEENQRVEIQHFRNWFTVSNRILGLGQYGAVFLAKEVPTSKQVACKIVDLNHAAKQLTEPTSSLNSGDAWRKGCARAATEKLRVKREIEILATLSHPHIVNLKKAFYSDSTLYIFTDLAPGGDLFSYVESHNGYLVDWHSRVIAWQVIIAVDYLHAEGIVHRDIKPENILITQTDFGGRVVLTDFGFANHVNKFTGRLMSKLGTAGFVAPEVDSREELAPEGYTKAADMWSFGVMAAFLLTGTQGVPPKSQSQFSQDQIVDRFCCQHSQWANIGPRALDFLRNLLVLDPSRRMTATETLNHSWFKKPLSEAAELEKGYKRIIRFWKGRNNEDRVIYTLPSPFVFAPPPQTNRSELLAPTTPRRLRDVSASPYFGLDRHLQNKLPSQRKELLASLSVSGSRFAVVKEPQKSTHLANQSKERTQSSSKVRAVDGRDIFNISMVDYSTPEFQDKSQDETQDATRVVTKEVKFIATTPVPCTKKPYGFSLSDPTQPISSPADPTTMRPIRRYQAFNRKRGRTDSEDIRIQEAAVKELPRFTTAKALKDMKDRLASTIDEGKMGPEARIKPSKIL